MYEAGINPARDAPSCRPRTRRRTPRLQWLRSRRRRPAWIHSVGDGTSNATLVGAYPNPVADGDPGEYVAVRFGGPTNATGWTLTDGNTVVRLPNRTFEGTVAFATALDEARRHTDRRVAELHTADSGWRAATPWSNYRVGRDFADAEPALGEFETRHDPAEVDYDAATVLVAPDNAGDAMVE